MRFVLNGEAVSVGAEIGPTTTLLQWLRRTARIGTKEGCAEGDCGACTVAVREPGGGAWRAVNACILLLPMVEGVEVVTVEGLAPESGIRGLASDEASLHPVQAAMVVALGSQCGFCTPGFVMSAFEACYRRDMAQEWKLDDQLCGNLCRCTGYRPIRDAVAAVAGLCPTDRFSEAVATREPRRPLVVEAAGQRFDAPTTLEDALQVLERAPTTRIVCGGTDLGLDVTQRHVHFPALLSVERIEALRGVRETAAGLWIGAATPLTDLEDATAQALPVLHRMLRYFGSRQIKHRATIGGNLCNASPIGDLAPVLLALDAVAIVQSAQQQRRVPLEAFFVGYRKTALEPGELLVAVEVPAVAESDRLGAYKVSRRRELDISAVAAGMRVACDPDGVVTLARLAYGGVAATPVRARATEKALVGRPFTEASVLEVLPVLDDELTPIDDHRGTAWFRKTLARNLLLGFVIETRASPFVPLPAGHAGTVVLPS